MRSKRRWRGVATVVCGAAALLLLAVSATPRLARSDEPAADSKNAPADPKPPADAKRGPRSAFMRAKLASSNLILEGLVTEDFDKIEKGALRLQVISTAAEWRVRDDALYKTYSDEFRRLTTSLKEAAGKKNLDGATLAYFDMTLQCIKCHQFVRKTPGQPKPE